MEKGFFYMKKKTLLLFLSAALACTMLTGCGGSSDDAAAPTVTDVSEGENTEEADEPTDAAEEEASAEEETREGMYRSELTNEWIDESLQNQRPVAIMVDNEKTARDSLIRWKGYFVSRNNSSRWVQGVLIWC